jgi:S-(hydroxymethyl)mycothiol dehydrogenase
MKVPDLPLIDVFGRGRALKSSWYGDCLPSRDFPMLVDLYQQGRLDLDAFRHRGDRYRRVEAAFDRLHSGEALRSVVLFQHFNDRPVVTAWSALDEGSRGSHVLVRDP